MNFYLLTLVMRQIKNETDKKLKNFMLEKEKNKMSILGTKEETLKGKKSLVIYFSHTGENYMSDGIRNIDKGNT